MTSHYHINLGGSPPVADPSSTAAPPAQATTRKRDRRAAEQGAGRQHPRLRPGLRRLPCLRLPPGLRHGRLLGRPDRLHRRRRPPPRRRFRRHLLLLRQAAAPIVSPLLLRHQIQSYSLAAQSLPALPGLAQSVTVLSFEGLKCFHAHMYIHSSLDSEGHEATLSRGTQRQVLQ